MNIIFQQDGSALFPSKQDPPESLSGFVVDPNNPWLFHPVWNRCKHRKHKLTVRPCGKQVSTWSCQHFKGALIDRLGCLACPVLDK